MTKAERKAKKATHRARKVVEAHAQLEQRTVAVIDGLSRRVEELEAVQAAFRATLFGAFLARGLEAEGVGVEPKASDAWMAAFPEWFRGKEDRPWMALSQQQS